MTETRTKSPRLPVRLFVPRAARKAIWLIGALALTGGAQTLAPASQAPMQSPVYQMPPNPLAGFGDTNPIEAEKRLKALNAERQKSLVSDTDKLLRLARELNAEVGGKNPGSLTPEELRKVAEIEKLAHNVKQKMSFSVGSAPALRDPFSPPIR